MCQENHFANFDFSEMGADPAVALHVMTNSRYVWHRCYCLCIAINTSKKKRASEIAVRPSKRLRGMTPDEPSASIAAGESSSAATGYEGTEDGLLGYHPLHDETRSQTTARRQDDARSRAQRRRRRQVQRGVTPSQSSSQPSHHPWTLVDCSPNDAQPSRPDQIAPDDGSSLGNVGVGDDGFEDDGLEIDGLEDDEFEDHAFENMPENSRAVSEEDWSLIRQFNQKLDDIRFETCTACNERWFDMDLKPNGQCSRCDKATRSNRLNKFAAENFMDPGDFPSHLPELDDTEEMLIARCHVHVEVQRYRGAQYKYAGHTVYFMQNTGKIYDKLPRLPREIEVSGSF